MPVIDPGVASVVSAAFAALAMIIVAIIEHNNSKDRKRAQERAERREKESRLSMGLMSATCELSVVTAVAMREGHTNGTLEPALEKAREAQANYSEFLRDEAAHAVAKI